MMPPLRKVCGGGAKDYMVLKGTLMISLSLSQAEQLQDVQQEPKGTNLNYFKVFITFIVQLGLGLS